MTDDLPQLWGFMGYPPNSSMGGGIILRNLLVDYPREKLTVVTNERVVAHLVARGDGGGLLAVSPHRHPPLAIEPARRPSCPPLRESREDLADSPSPGAESAGGERDPGHTLGRRVRLRIVRDGLSCSPVLGRPAGRLRDGRVACLPRGKSRLSRPGPWRTFHRPILRAARSVWSISPSLAEEFRQRFGVESRVMAHCVDVSAYSRGRHGERARAEDFRLLYTGTIYGAQAGALRNTLRAIQTDQDRRMELWVYTNERAEALAAFGIHGPGLYVQRQVPVEAMPELLGTADALVLPLSFDDDQRAIVETALPTKTADYLASGVPLLVHAPPYASISRLARAEGWGLVVDDPDPQCLYSSLRRLGDDAALRRDLVDRALQMAAVRHDIAPCRAMFYDSLCRAVGRATRLAEASPATP